MLIELFVALTIIGIAFFLLAFFYHGGTNSELLWGIAVVVFAILMISAVSVESLEPFYNATGNYYYIDTYHHIDLTFIGINLLFMSLSILGFYVDTMAKYGKVTDGTKKE